MRGFTIFIRSIFAVLFAVVLVGLLLVSIPTVGVMNVVTDEENPKIWLEEANVYNKMSDTIIDQAIEQASVTAGDQVVELLSEKEVKTVLKNNFGEAWLKEVAETNIDGLYKFLEDESDDLNFEINLDGKQQKVKDDLTSALKKKFALMPKCDSASLSTDYYSFIDKNCIPEQVKLDDIYKYIDEQTKDEVVLTDSKIEVIADDLDIETKENIVSTYNWFKSASLISLIAIITLSVFIILLVPAWARGFLFIGIIFIMIGGLYLGGMYMAESQFDKLYDRITQEIELNTEEVGDQSEMEELIIDSLIKDGTKAAYDDISNEIKLYSVILSVAGVICIITNVIISKLQKRDQLNVKVEEQA